MKKTLLSLILILSMLVCSCEVSVSTSATTTAETTTSASESTYKDTPRRKASKYQTVTFGTEHSDILLQFSLPSEWSFHIDANQNYVIEREGTPIGAIVTGESADRNEWERLEQNEHIFNGLTAEELVEKNSDAYRFRYRYTYSDKIGSQTVTLTASYEEINDYSAFQLLQSTFLKDQSTETQFSTLSELKNKSVLILGNSFIGSSEIADILEQMLEKNGKKTSVEAIGIGMANVDTFANNSEIMSDIRSGKYDAVMTCGFYTKATAEAVSKILSACNTSKTALIMLPAHNESDSKIQEIHDQFETVKLLNWKKEVERLISYGIDKWDMCEDDYHKHSKPLAGYVGAHLIYRAIYGTVPAPDLYYGVDLNEVNKLPDHYLKTGSLIQLDYPIGS